MPKDRIAELERQRFAFLKELYDRSGDGTLSDFPAKDIGQKLGFDKKLTENIHWYLKEEGLLEYLAMGPQVAITHAGIKEIEGAATRQRTSRRGELANEGGETIVRTKRFTIIIGRFAVAVLAVVLLTALAAFVFSDKARHAIICIATGGTVCPEQPDEDVGRRLPEEG